MDDNKLKQYRNKRNSKQKEYYKNNHSARLDYAREYYRIHKHEMKQDRLRRGKEYRETHQKEIVTYRRAYKKEHPDKMEKSRRQWSERHPESHGIRSKKYIQSHPEKRAAFDNNRRIRKLSGQGKFTSSEWKMLCSMYGNMCLACRDSSKKLTADHIIPLSRGGTNYISNIQPLCKSCNSKKHTHIIDYRQNYVWADWT